MKRLPLWRRPFGSKKILEVGGGHNPYKGITHAVDKHPFDNSERGLHDYVFQKGVKFLQGELEKLPFKDGEKFDFMYASHVLEHVSEPEKAVAEINRVTSMGYIETPAPIWEQLCIHLPYNPVTDIHKSYVWAEGEHDLFVVMKSERVIDEFCDCEFGRLAAKLSKIHHGGQVNVERLLPSSIKATKFHFKTPLKLKTYASFKDACADGHCAYRSLKLVSFYTFWPLSLVSGKFRRLKSVTT